MKHEFRVNSCTRLELSATSPLEEQLLSELLNYTGVEMVKEAGKVIIRKKTKNVEHDSRSDRQHSSIIDNATYNT